MSKFYRVKKDTFMWVAGAILKWDGGLSENGGGYRAMNDLWDATDLKGEYITAHIIENNPDWFERVYEVNMLTHIVYEVRDEARKLCARGFKK